MSKSRYQLLPRSDQTPAVEVDLSSVPSGNATAATSSLQIEQNQVVEIDLREASVQRNSEANVRVASDELPPSSELPSYHEALRLKKLESGEIPPSYFSSVNGEENRIPIEPSEFRTVLPVEAVDVPLNDEDIGSECMFLSAFMIAFFFNWIGFFTSICLLPNAAGKYGALSGFGLSMAKWVTIVRYQDWMANNVNDFQQKLFFWLFIFLGFYMFFRGLINYMSLKYRPRVHTEYSRRVRDRWLGL